MESVTAKRNVCLRKGLDDGFRAIPFSLCVPLVGILLEKIGLGTDPIRFQERGVLYFACYSAIFIWVDVRPKYLPNLELACMLSVYTV